MLLTMQRVKSRRLIMSHDFSAKKIVTDQAEKLAGQLENGHAEDPVILSRAVAHLIKMVVPMYNTDFEDFVRKDDCLRVQNQIKNGLKPPTKNTPTKIKIGPFALEGNVTPALIASIIPFACVGILAFVLAKTNGWI